MARVIAFGAELGAIIATTDLRAGVRWGKEADARDLLAHGLSQAMVDWLISEQAPFVVADDGGRIVGHILYATGEKVEQYDWLSIRQQVGSDIFSSGAFVAPQCRGQGLVGAMKGFAARCFADRGYRRNLSVVQAANEASIRAHTRIGGIPICRLTRIRLGKLNLVWQGRSLKHVDRRQPFVLSL